MRVKQIIKTLSVFFLCGAIALNSSAFLLETKATETAGNATAENAAAEDEDLTPEEKQQKEYEEKLKKAYELPIQTNDLPGWPEAVGTYGDAAIVMDAETGAVLYAKNIDKQEYPASITKVLTALLVFEYEAMDLEVVISPESMECIRDGYASIGMDEGNVITMEQAMHAMLLASSNEVAYAIGEAVAESQGEDYEWFLERMNQRCKELGGVNSNFLNTNGVFDEKHYSCALDMALISRALFEYPEFFEICQTPQYTIPESSTTEEHVFQQKHHMLLDYEEEYYKYAIGGKTGYTTEAQNTLITMADNGESQLICVVLYEYPGYVYSDTQALLEYGFANFEKVSLANEKSLQELEGFPEEAYATLPKGVTLDDAKQEITSDDASEKTFVEYTYEGMTIASYEIDYQELAEIEAAEMAEKEAREAEEEAAKKEARQGTVKAVLKVAGTIAGILIVLFIALLIYAKVRREKRRKERMRRRRAARRRAEMTEQQVRTAERRARSTGQPLQDGPRTRSGQRPVNRDQNVYRNASRSQNVPRDRRPRNRRFD